MFLFHAGFVFARQDISYDCVSEMPVEEFGRIVRNLSVFGEFIHIACQSKQELVFSSSGEMGKGKIICGREGSSKGTNRVANLKMNSPCQLFFPAK